MMKLPSWLRRADATRSDLEAQVSEARAALEQARLALTTAEETFDLDGSPESEKQVLAARSQLERAELHDARAGRLLAARQEAERAAERVRLQARRDELQASLELAAMVAELAPSTQAEAKALEAAAMARAAFEKADRAIEARRAELARVLGQLGEPITAPRFNTPDANAGVASALEARVKEIGSPEAERYLRKLIDLFAPMRFVFRPGPPPDRHPAPDRSVVVSSRDQSGVA